MDLQMPEMDGFAATKLLRADPSFQKIPILAMTAHALVEERERCLAAGMNDHVTKPIDPDALFAALARWVTPRAATAGAPPTKAAATPVPAAELAPADAIPEIEGVDVVGGLKRVAGNRRLYRSLLDQFTRKQADTDVRISEALANADRETAERLAHTLKGIAGNMGIGGVQALAAKVEKGIREGDAAVLAMIAELNAVLGPQVGAIRAALGGGGAPAAPTTGPFDAEVASRAVARLMSLIETNDGDAPDAVQEVVTALAGKIDMSRLNALRDSLDEFDFDGARTRLSQIAGECHLTLG